ncbi:Protein TolB [Novipirellula artificiosorum]|uniref:Protein TolB n=2 Tax=Novipirellula artificiosorum TaxID=2528016 RepID=A0A5C6DAR0_9BACT|nr:Protein TolB [Novipirellula artificiosorum]
MPAVPLDELVRDWVMQDFGLQDDKCFCSDSDGTIEAAMVRRVLDELQGSVDPLRRRLREYQQQGVSASDPRWKSLYVDACSKRREQRLQIVIAKAPRIVYTRHHNLGGSHYAYTEAQSDGQAERNFRPGAALCIVDVDAGLGRVRTLLEDPQGVIRDPDVSHDGQRVLFAWKKSDRLDDYHLYEFDLETEHVRQLTFGLGFADYEGIYLPDGNVLLNSTRCVQTVDCWWTEVSNLYTCDLSGHNLRRISFDQVHTNYPQLLEDGRVIYTRWDYNDRGQVFPQPLFQMNADGTNQTEFYGNNSWFPTTVLHARGIPGTQKLVAVLSGHHSDQRGKLAIIDPSKGTQEAEGVQLIAPVRETKAVRIDSYGQEGDQFQYPFALSETDFLVTYDPIGSGNHRYNRPYGVYWMSADGRRELLAWNSELSSNQSVPLQARPPQRIRPNEVDYRKDEGVYYLKDIYAGPGLKGIPRGTVKRLRVVALEFRAAGIGANGNQGPAGGALVSTPVAISNGSWDVKRVLGEANVYEDGSACYRVPARTPVYFQALNEKGHVVQTMRTWSTLQPGEVLSCVGCHESKSEAASSTGGSSSAQLAGPQDLDPFYGPARGFSFNHEIQPILDRHCVRCHNDRQTLWSSIDPTREIANADPLTLNGTSFPSEGNTETSILAFSLLSDSTIDAQAKRYFSDGYLALTHAVMGTRRGGLAGTPNAWVNWIDIQSSPVMLPPYHAGAANSRLFDLLEQGHYEVELTREELEKMACWIDLLVPYCGDYTEANAWSDAEQQKYSHFASKRQWMADQVDRNVAALLGNEPTVVAKPNNTYRNLAIHSRASDHPKQSASQDPDKQQNVWWQMHFGKQVTTDRISLFLPTDAARETQGYTATLEFSDGSRERIRIAKTAERQDFTFAPRTMTSLQITTLSPAPLPGWPGFNDIEIWGRDAEDVPPSWKARNP